jgi:putative two-component system response regulator
MALERGYVPPKAKQIGNAAALHDIGKQRISAAILDKPGKLDAQEFEIMKNHTKLGVEMLASMRGELGEMAALICLFHHEFYSGGGYWNVPAYYLPEYVSIVAIADVFTACCSKRSYKDAWPPQDALAFIQQQAGTQFCPELVDIFIPLVRNDNRISAIFNTNINERQGDNDE